MSRFLFLDSAPLGLITHPQQSARVAAITEWLSRCILGGDRVIVPAIVYYELKRELLRAKKTASIARLDAFVRATPGRYLPLSDEALRLAAELWARARQAGQPTSDRTALDIDVILAAQALSFGPAQRHHCRHHKRKAFRAIRYRPRLERDRAISGGARELESLAKLASAPKANPPTETLIRALRDQMAIAIRRLGEHDEVDNFDCGDDALNNYLKRHAWSNQQKSSIAVSYVALDEGAPRTVLGYFTLAMASVARDMFLKKYVRGLPPYDLPLILLARFAVDQRFAGRGLGHSLISEALRISLRMADEVGCRGIITDAYRDRVSWYARYGFVPIEGTAAAGPQRMFLDVRTPSPRKRPRVVAEPSIPRSDER